MRYNEYNFYVLEDDLEGGYVYTIYAPDGRHVQTRGGLDQEDARQQALTTIKQHERFLRTPA